MNDRELLEWDAPFPASLEYGISDLMRHAADEIERLRAALSPFAGLFLPEDTGIYGTESWQEPFGDMPDDKTTNDFFIAYGDIRRARRCLPVPPSARPAGSAAE